MKKLLLLGGLHYLVPVIEAAKELGHYVITCDYLPDNIAHKYSDEYHNVSIVDRAAVLELAQSLKIDGIMSFAVDPGVVTAAYVAEKMELPAPGPLKSIEVLQNKALFRQFLKAHDFNVPRAESYSDIQKALNEFKEEHLPVIVKPVDAAGSKGVTKVTKARDLKRAIVYALQFSQSKTFIIEEFLESKGYASDFDCFSIEGKLVFTSFNNQYFDIDAPNPYTPAAFSWPSTMDPEQQQYLQEELQRLIKLLDMKSSLYNIEVREATNGKAYLMEVSPRGGGNRLSEMVRYITGVDLIKNAIQAAIGEYIGPIAQMEIKNCWGQVVLYSNKDGIFKGLEIREEVQNEVVEVELRVNRGDKIKALSAANDTIGTVILRFENKNKMKEVLADYRKFFQVLLS